MDISQMAHVGGVANYTQNLAIELSKIQDLDMVYFYSSFRKPYRGGLKNVKKYKLPPTLFEMLFNRWRNVPIEKFIGPVDIFHSSDWTQPPSKAKKVTTIHDLVPLKYPQWSHPKVVAVHKRRLWLVQEEVDCIIVVSESAKKDLLELTQIPEKKVRVIYEGPTYDFKKQSKQKILQFKNKYNLPDKFVLAIGGVGERRNMQRVQEACKNYNLVIAGQTIPWLDFEQLGLLYQSAQVLLYPSLYEGFGLPILDAFVCGTPVITSNVSSMPEVGGNAVLYVDPFDTEDIKEKLRMAIEDKDLRQELIEKGFKQAKKFSWEKTASETANVYHDLAGN